MIWRLHADIYFTTAQRRTQFVNAWTAWAATKGATVVSELQALDADGGDSEAVPPIPPTPLAYRLLRMDVAFLNDQVNVDALEFIKLITPSWLRYAFASLHRCAVGTGSPALPDGPSVYWSTGIPV